MAIDDHTPHLHVTVFHDKIDENTASAWRNLRAFRVRIVSLATAASRSAFVIMPSAVDAGSVFSPTINLIQKDADPTLMRIKVIAPQAKSHESQFVEERS